MTHNDEAQPRKFSNHRQAFEHFTSERIKMSRPAVGFSLCEGDPYARPQTSRIGGRPALEDSEKWPSDPRTGLPMTFLAQIDLAANPRVHFLPSHGLLQFFVARTEDFGCNFPSYGTPQERAGFMVRLLRPEAILDVPDSVPGPDYFDLSPLVTKEALAIQGIEITMQPSMDCEFDMESNPELQNAFNAFTDADVSNDDLNKYEDAIYKSLDAEGEELPFFILTLGGYPSFTQMDIRMDSDRIVDMAPLLTMQSRGGVISWVDCGIANFFVNPEKSAQGDFSDTAYSWDCH